MIRRQVPYYHQQRALGAQFVDRIGYDAAYVYTSTEAEHRATREQAGLYEVYHQGPIEIRGRQATALLRRTLVNDVARLADGKVLYSSVCNHDGGMIDDLTCYRLAPDRYWLSPTPSRADAVVAWLTSEAQGTDAYVIDLISGTGFISVQGPNARTIVGKLVDVDLSTDALPYFSFSLGRVDNVPAMIARTGYSGELGYELFYPREYAEGIWDTVVAAGADHGLTPCGLGALRSVRMEKKYPLYGLDLNETTSPLEAGLGWTIRFEDREFNGRAALDRQREEGVTRKLVLIEFDDLDFRLTPGDAVAADGNQVGTISSADPGYFIGKYLAMAYLPPALAEEGQAVTATAASGETRTGAVRLRAPYDPNRARARQ